MFPLRLLSFFLRVGSLLPLAAAAAAVAADLAPVAVADRPTGLLCELLSQPEKSVITARGPEFGWIVPTRHPDDRQTAYRLLVASTPALLAREIGDLWDSGRVAAAQSINVRYAGRPLAPQQRYWWAVQTWDRLGQATAFSAPQCFCTGEFDRPDRRWPGESRWVSLADEQGQLRWTLENRPPTAFHPRPPVRLVRASDGSSFLDFGRAAFAALELTLAWTPADPAQRECTVQVALGEKNQGTRVDPKPGGGIIFGQYPLRLRPGEHTYTVELPRFKPRYPHSQVLPAQLPEVMPFRYVHVAPGQENVVAVAGRQLCLWSLFDDEAASFACSDATLNAIYELCKYSVKVNTFNGDYAASQRERMMYEADSHIHQTSHYAVDREYSIGRYSLENMIFHASWPTEWIPHAIFMAWADYRQTGSTRCLERYYEELKPKTLLALAGPDGLISTRTGRQTPEFLRSIHFNGKELKDIVDWPTGEADGFVFTDYNTVVNAFHYRALALMAELARVLGRAADAADYAQRAARVQAVFQEKFFAAQRGVYVDGLGTDHASLHANLFPLAFGLVPAAHRASVVAFVKSRGMACSVYPTVFLLDALYEAGEEQYALDLMRATSDRSWVNMLRVGSTVTTEAWDIKYKKNGGWTHAWSTAPVQIIPRRVLGIVAVEPGFGRVRIQPSPGDLTQAQMRLPTIRGPIAVAYRRLGPAACELRVTLPANVTADIGVPTWGHPGADVRVDGQFRPGRRDADGRRVWIDAVGAGTHTFVYGER